jgi:DNA-binding XRE family transcriptional regulator
MDRDRLGRLDTEPHLRTLEAHDGDPDIVADIKYLSNSSSQDQHLASEAMPQIGRLSDFQISESKIYLARPHTRRRPMAKTIHRHEYRVLLKLLKEHRIQAGVTQTDVSAALGRSQSFMSDIERGVRRLDLVELHDILGLLKIDLKRFVQEFERSLPRRHKRN